MVLQIEVYDVFSHLTGGLEYVAENSNIPWIPPTIFQTSQIATVYSFFTSAYRSLSNTIRLRSERR